jgi:hypothetical protein
MPEGTDVFEIIHSTRAMRRLKPFRNPQAIDGARARKFAGSLDFCSLVFLGFRKKRDRRSPQAT